MSKYFLRVPNKTLCTVQFWTEQFNGWMDNGVYNGCLYTVHFGDPNKNEIQKFCLNIKHRYFFQLQGR